MRVTRKRLAEELGKPYATITKYENGEREAGSGYLISIAEKFNVTTDYLLGIEDDQSAETKKSPAPAEAKAREINAKHIMDVFVSAGIMPAGEDLSNEDLIFLRSIANAVFTWFQERHQTG